MADKWMIETPIQDMLIEIEWSAMCEASREANREASREASREADDLTKEG